MNTKLKLAEDALRRIALNISGDTVAQVVAGECLSAMKSADAEPVASSIDGPEFQRLAELWRNNSYGSNAFMGSWDALTQNIDQHCAAQVVQEHESVWVDAGREIDRIAKERDEARAQLVDQTDARNLAITERVEITKYCDDLRDQLAQALAAKPAPDHVNGVIDMAAKPAPTDAEITAMALGNGFKLKQQPDGGLALNPYVFEFARALLNTKPSPFKPDWHDYRQGVRDGREDTVIEMDRDEAHAMVRTGRPTADLIREAFAAGATYRAKVDSDA